MMKFLNLILLVLFSVSCLAHATDYAKKRLADGDDIGMEEFEDFDTEAVRKVSRQLGI